MTRALRVEAEASADLVAAAVAWHASGKAARKAELDILTYDRHVLMHPMMRTTVRLNEALLERARQEAARRGTTLTSLIEQGLRLVLRRPQKRSERPPVTLPECRAGGGTLPGVDLADSASLVDRMEDRA